MEQKIEIWLIRHGKTPENEQHRYIGWLDSSLGSAGKAELIRASETVSKVWVTNRRRTQETAQILFPGAEQILVPGLEEMNFGSFEGKNFEESIKLFEKGVALSAECVKLLNEGKGKLTELKKTLEGLEEISLEFDE